MSDSLICTTTEFRGWVRLSKRSPWQALSGSFPDKGSALRAALDHVHACGLAHADVLVLPADQRPDGRGSRP